MILLERESIFLVWKPNKDTWVGLMFRPRRNKFIFTLSLNLSKYVAVYQEYKNILKHVRIKHGQTKQKYK